VRRRSPGTSGYLRHNVDVIGSCRILPVKYGWGEEKLGGVEAPQTRQRLTHPQDYKILGSSAKGYWMWFLEALAAMWQRKIGAARRVTKRGGEGLTRQQENTTLRGQTKSTRLLGWLAGESDEGGLDSNR
jgi:hypothetical protein